MGLTQKDAEGFRTRADGSKLELLVDTSGYGADAAVIYKENLAAIGLRLTIDSTTDEVISGRRMDAKYHFLMFNEGCFNVWTYPSRDLSHAGRPHLAPGRPVVLERRQKKARRLSPAASRSGFWRSMRKA